MWALFVMLKIYFNNNFYRTLTNLCFLLYVLRNDGSVYQTILGMIIVLLSPSHKYVPAMNIYFQYV